ncbi:family 20 glycosylhydrolase [Bacteroidota bacterium]
MRKLIILSTFFLCFIIGAVGQEKLDELLLVRGLCLPAPDKETVDPFIKFINEELVPMKVNTLVLRIGYNFEYESHPELRTENALSKGDINKMKKACKDGGIRIIPLINLLGHQSWYGSINKLLEVYPEFNESPDFPPDGQEEWERIPGRCCLSYCSLHPEVHDVIFDVVDEIVEVFESDAFHAGMDEVYYIGYEKCPRCSGRDKAELFAGEVTRIRDHLALNDKELWIWGDRLIDGKTTGLGYWSASMNNTHRAIDMIPKDVVINDWHYHNPDPTAVVFALKGFKVVTCPYRKADVARKQLHMIVQFRENATQETKENYYGMMQTIWNPTSDFLDYYYGRRELDQEDERGNYVECFKVLFKEINKLDD